MLSTTEKIFVYGGQVNRAFVAYTAQLTGKSMPRICFLPTALGDSPEYIDYWSQLCEGLPMRPYVQRMFIGSSSQKTSFEEVLLSMDALIVGGGNTLNMLAVWKAHGLDQVLKSALSQGVLLAGGSAGSICWFEEGLTDSRPVSISKIECLGFLKGSHCPHYHSEPGRRPMYLSHVEGGLLAPGYALDDLAGLYFENDEVKEVISLDNSHNAYHVGTYEGKLVEKALDKTLLKWAGS